uniref:RRM domain-containing protein n=1 Tax=Denticeps clupeoides TaxID=299321 RepID=A0AAY4BIH8_9TELE
GLEVPPRGRGALKLSNGYILPEGKMTPNTLFVGGIDMKVDENEIKEFFAKYGAVKEVKIITYRGGICKGYGFIYFSEDVDIQTIVEQPISFKGRKLKLGPAIMKERTSRMSRPSGCLLSPSQSIYCACCPPAVGVQPNSPVLNTAGPYMQVCVKTGPVCVCVCVCVFQNYVDCGVQTLLTLL